MEAVCLRKGSVSCKGDKHLRPHNTKYVLSVPQKKHVEKKNTLDDPFLKLVLKKKKKNPEHHSRYEWLHHGKWSNVQALGVTEKKKRSNLLIW